MWPVILIKICVVWNVGDWKMAQEKGAFPVQVIDFWLNWLKPFAGHHFFEPLLHSLLVVLFCEPLHSVHQLNGYPMVHQLWKTKPTKLISLFHKNTHAREIKFSLVGDIVISTSKKPQFSQASFIISMAAALSSVLSFPMSTTGKFAIFFFLFLSL